MRNDMKLYRFPDNKKWTAAFWAYLFVMLLLARDTLVTHCIVSFYPSQLTVAALVVILGTVFLAVNRKDLKTIFRDGRILAFAIAAASPEKRTRRS